MSKTPITFALAVLIAGLPGTSVFAQQDLTKTCDAGDAKACFDAALIQVNGDGVPVDLDRGLELSNKGCHAEKGFADACALSNMIILNRQSEILVQTSGYLAGSNNLQSYQFDALNREFDTLQESVELNRERMCKLDSGRC